MKKNTLIFLLMTIISMVGIAQDDWIQRLNVKWNNASHDTTKVLVMAEYSNYYKSRKLDSALVYGFEALSLARKINFPEAEVKAIQYIAITYYNLGNDSKGLQLCLHGIDMAEKYNMPFEKSFLKIVVGRIYTRSGNYQEALKSFREAKSWFDNNLDHLNVNNQLQLENTLKFIGNTYLEMNQLDSALHFAQLAYKNAMARLNSTENWVIHSTAVILGNIHSRKNNPNQALNYFRQSLVFAIDNEDFFKTHYSLAQQFNKISKPDSAIHHAEISLNYALQSSFYKYIINANVLLSNIYEDENPPKALQYSKNVITYLDSLNNLVNNSIQKTIIEYDEQQRQIEIEATRKEFQSRLKINMFLGSTFTLMVIAIFLFILSRRKQRAKLKIESAFNHLKATQSQLIQSEKMASLGELTAGIAHEIQNPLNFVNNFSEVNIELLDDLKEAIDNNDYKEIEAILNDLKENENKVSNHGKRAESIVKGMLLHSRGSSGKKEPTDINALCDEYVRLAYHGFRAKDKSFNADYKLEIDESLPKINVVPQDFGRVLLNLINNAFYAVNEKAKSGVENYKPEVIVSTSFLTPSGGKRMVKITVADNGPGIPNHIKDKIFQPFFTTKSTGQGTGLGLSLAYDIVKGHGGELKVESNVGEGTKFLVSLPIS